VREAESASELKASMFQQTVMLVVLMLISYVPAIGLWLPQTFMPRG
jgi:TRAP-type C4-dicarboxylate transport system permease large subunit